MSNNPLTRSWERPKSSCCFSVTAPARPLEDDRNLLLDSGQGGPQFVGDHGHKFIFHPVHGLQIGDVLDDRDRAQDFSLITGYGRGVGPEINGIRILLQNRFLRNSSGAFLFQHLGNRLGQIFQRRTFRKGFPDHGISGNL